MVKPEISAAGKTETSVAESDAPGNKTDTSVVGAKSDAPDYKTETLSAGAETDAPGNMMETSVASVESDAPDNKSETSIAGSESDASVIKTETAVVGVESYLPGNNTEIPVLEAASDAFENKPQRSFVGTESAASGAKQKTLGARRKRLHSYDREEMKPKRRVTFKDPIREPSPIRCLSTLNFGGAEGVKDAKFINASSLKSSLKSPNKSLKVKEKIENAHESLSIARHDKESDRMDEIETSGAESDAPGNKVKTSVVAEIAASGVEQKVLGARPKCFLSRDKGKKKQSYKRRVTFKDPIREPSPIRCFSPLNLEGATETQDSKFKEASPLQSCLKSPFKFRKVKEKRKNALKTRLISSFDKESDRIDEPETSGAESEDPCGKQKSLDSLSKCFRHEDQSKQFSTHRFVIEEVFQSPVKESGPSNIFSAFHMERTKNANFGGGSSLQSSSKSPYSPRKVRKACINAREQDSVIDTARNRIIDIVYDEMPASEKGAMAKLMLKSFGSLTTNRLHTKEGWMRILNSLCVSLDIVAKTAEDKIVLYNDEDPYSKSYRNIHFQEINVDGEVIKAVNEHGFVKPSAVERALVKKFLGYRKNVIVEAPPGSGKTTSLIMACLRTIDLNLSHPQAIIVYFRRADSAEALNVAKEMTKYLPEVAFHMAVYPFHEGTVDKQVIIGKPFDVLFLINNHCFNPKNIVTLAMDDVHNASADDFIIVCEKLLTRMRKTVFAVSFSNPAITPKIPVMGIMTQIVKNPAYVKVSSKKCIVHFLFYCFRESEKATFIKKAYKIFNRISSKFIVFYNYPDSLLERIDNLRNKVCVLHEYLSRKERKHRLMNFRSKPDIMCTFSNQSNLFTILGDFVRTVVNLKEPFARTGKIEIAGVVINFAAHIDEYSINELNEWFEYRVLNI